MTTTKPELMGATGRRHVFTSIHTTVSPFRVSHSYSIAYKLDRQTLAGTAGQRDGHGK